MPPPGMRIDREAAIERGVELRQEQGLRLSR
jgi:hypothetical protein